MNEYYTIVEAINILKNYALKTQPIINGYCKAGKVPAKMLKNKWYIEKDYIEKALVWRKNAVSLCDVIDSISHAINENITKSRNVAAKIKDYIEPENSFSILFADIFVKRENTEEIIDVIFEEEKWLTAKKEAVPIYEAAEIIGISRYRLMEIMKSGLIKGFLSKNCWYIRKEEINSFISKKDQYISIYEIAKSKATEATIFDIENRIDRAQLNAYILSSDISPWLLTWDDMGFREDRRNSLYIPREYASEAEKIVTEYIEKFGKKAEILAQYITNDYWNKIPLTKALLTEFSDKKSDVGMAALCETIIKCIDCEIFECTNSDIERMREYAENAGTIIYIQYLVMFISYVRKHKKCNFTLELVAPVKKIRTNSNAIKPYSVSEYFKMSYMTFNDEYINEHHLVEKAIMDSQNAYVWLFVAMHYLCAWRKSDIELLPIVELPYSSQEVFARIKEHRFNEEALKISILLQDEVNNLRKKPKKTEDRQNERFLTIEIPTTLRIVFGTIYSIYCAHVTLEHYINKNLKVVDYIRFYGDKYQAIFGNTAFSNRRANKSFLDQIVDITERTQGVDRKIMGYKVASYARAHVEGAAGISEVTSKYLQCKMDGLDVNEILMMLFEAGTCSFIPFFLLEIIYGDRFSNLNIKDQTEVMKMTGLNAYKTETLSKALVTAYRRTKNLIDAFFSQYHSAAGKKVAAEQMLNNIVEKSALARVPGMNCMCAAKRLPCPFPSRECPGCIYGIYETSFFFQIMDKVRSAYQKLGNAKTENERRKIQAIIDDELLPASCELLSIAKSKYGIDVEIYKQELIDMINSKGYIELC